MVDQDSDRPCKRLRLADSVTSEQFTATQLIPDRTQYLQILCDESIHQTNTAAAAGYEFNGAIYPTLLPKPCVIENPTWQQKQPRGYVAAGPDQVLHSVTVTTPIFAPQFDESFVRDSQQFLPNEGGSHVPKCYGLSEDHEMSQGSHVLSEALIAYGSLTNIQSTIDNPNCNAKRSEFTVELNSSSSFTSTDGSNLQGKIVSTTYNQMIASLLEENSIQLHVHCSMNGPQRIPRKSFIQPCTLSITIYGPPSLLDDIGTWAQGYDVYLQDPQHCHLRVRYCNPHKLSSASIEDSPWLSDFLSSTQGLPDMQEIQNNRDLLDILETRQNLEEAKQPVAVKTPLQRHQKQALTFMLQREKGWNFRNEGDDIWKVLDYGLITVFLNTISNSTQADEPVHLSGGVIADTMGLGKTLTMIALVTSDLDDTMAGGDPQHTDGDDETGQESTPATLIVVLPSLLSTWEEQISQHLQPGFVRVFRHHGKARLSERPMFSKGDIVLTTYHTISAEWQADANLGTSAIFKYCWRRIIIDEAHMIKNNSARMTQATCAIEAVSRWAVTATPLQNRLKDLGSLLQFIRAHPYDDPHRFDTDLSQLWKDGESTEAVNRLQHLSSCLILRRSKDAIDLPPRKDMLCPIDFTDAEREEYDLLRGHAIAHIDSILHERSKHTPQVNRTYVNALQQIETLRLFCNLGQHYHDRKTYHADLSDWKGQAQSVFLQQCEIQPVICVQCSSATDIVETLMDLNDTESRRRSPAMFFSCLRLLCSDCVDECRRLKQALLCGHSPSCPGASVSISATGDLDANDALNIPEVGSGHSSGMEISSKVKAVVADLQTVPSDVKSIIFSTWRLSLDMVQHALDQHSIKNIRFDGRVPQKQRQPIIDQFQNDPNVRVMLLTLGCGAVGLTLTAASRAYLMEPHWNPTLEEQALARIHRLGQTRPVTTVRLYMRNSFEEEVMKVQTSKKDLASILLSPHDGGQADTSLGALERLRSFL